MIIFLSISLRVCFGNSKEPSDRDGSFEYPQHMFWWRNKKNNFLLRNLICGPGLIMFFLWSTLFVACFSFNVASMCITRPKIRSRKQQQQCLLFSFQIRIRCGVGMNGGLSWVGSLMLSLNYVFAKCLFDFSFHCFNSCHSVLVDLL